MIRGLTINDFEKVESIIEQLHITRLHFVGVDMLSYFYSDKLNMLNKREFEEYLKFLSTICIKR